MVTVTVIRGFRDLDVHVDRKPGDTFTATEGRAKEIEARLPGYVTYTTSEPKSELDGLSVEELKAMCEERGIKVPARAGRARLAALLEG